MTAPATAFSPSLRATESGMAEHTPFLTVFPGCAGLTPAAGTLRFLKEFESAH